MGNSSRILTPFLAILIVGAPVMGQTGAGAGAPAPIEWRRIGNSALDVALASLAGGPVERVWYAADGSRLYALTASGVVLETEDFEKWRASPEAVAPADSNRAMSDSRLPESRAIARLSSRPGLAYALGRAVYRTQNGGRSWVNLTEYKGSSILGGRLADLAVSPANEEEIVAGGLFGVWRSMDGGLSWSGLNDSLPNLPVRRLLQAPASGQPARALLAEVGPVEWAPGERTAWRPVTDYALEREVALRAALSDLLGSQILAVAVAGEYIYAGAGEGRLWVSSDRGASWRDFQVDGAGDIERIVTLTGQPTIALVASAGSDAGSGARVLRTVNGGIFWDDLTANLPAGAAHGVAAHLDSGTVYVATDAGAFLTTAELRSAGAPTSWTRLGGLPPNRAAHDVKLDDGANRLFVALDGEGIYAAAAPHRRADPEVVHTADLIRRAAAPGVLLSILGRRVEAVRAGDLDVPVLGSSDAESQIQVPFEAAGDSVSLALRDAGSAARYTLGLPLLDASPAIFVDTDGTPMLLDVDSGVLLDATQPARPGGRIQILASGLGRVRPDWPTGLPGPLENPPEVIAEVRVMLDRVPAEITRATLAPGYIGFYVVEIQVPDIVNAGPAELYLEVAGHESNRTRIYLEP